MVKDVRVVVLPFVAFGHLMPFFQLSVALSKHGVRVSFVSTPRNIRRLPPLPKDIAHLVTMVGLPFPQLAKDLLPPDAEATVDISPEDFGNLHLAYDLLATPFKQFVSDNSPDWIFCDLVPHWAVDIAHEYNIPLIAYHVMSTATLVFFGPPEYLIGDGQKKVRSSPESFTIPPPWVNFPSSVAYWKFDATNLHGNIFGSNATDMTMAKCLAKVYQGCHALAIRSCNEIEGDYLDLSTQLFGKPVIPVGLLPPDQEKRETSDEYWNKIFQWLDKQKPRSVVFVGFGSECKLTKDQVFEIANGMEASELPFLWGLQKPKWASCDNDALPLNFVERTTGKGVVHIGWIPQREILAHPSIGGCLFHSGWGSTIEALQNGHSLVVLPFVADQALNARMLVDKGLALEVERNEEDGGFSGVDIAKCLKKTMELAEGEDLRKKARAAALYFGDEKLHQEHYMGGFVEFLRKGVITK